MHYFIIGDVHGCVHTFEKILESWNPNTQKLIQVGDLVDRGNFIVETVAYAKELQSKHPENAIFLMGNHEDEVIGLLNIDEFENPFFFNSDTLRQYKKANKDIHDDLDWFSSLPLYYEDECVFVSHAGLSSIGDPFDRNNLIWHRFPILDINKTQVYGHTPQFNQKPFFDPSSHSIDIDTACVYGGKLSAIVLNETGKVIDLIQVNVDPRDINLSYFTQTW